MDGKRVPGMLRTGRGGVSALTSIKSNRFLKLILMEHKTLSACFGFVTSQKWLV